MINLPGSDAFNVVLVGSWNPAIFSPEWAKQNLADDKEKEVVLAIPMQMMAMPPRLTVDNINIYPSTQALVLDCVEYSDVVLEVCSRKLDRIAALLPHTPVTAVGLNFRFLGNLEENLPLADLFAFSDAGKIDSTKFTLTTALIKRAYTLQDSTVLNISLESQGGQLRVEFNFHSNIKNLSEITTKTNLARVQSCRSQAIEFMKTVYDVQMDNEGETTL